MLKKCAKATNRDEPAPVVMNTVKEYETSDVSSATLTDERPQPSKNTGKLQKS